MNAGVALRLPVMETESCADINFNTNLSWQRLNIVPNWLEKHVTAALKLTAKKATQILADSNRATDISDGLHLYSSTEN